MGRVPSPTVKRRLSDLKLNMAGFTKTAISPFPHSFMYSNKGEGFDFTVDELEDEIKTIDYYASTVDCERIIKTRAPKYRNSWRGLIPLHSNRRDVEKLLGSPQRAWKSTADYETDHEMVTVKYAKGKCGELNSE